MALRTLLSRLAAAAALLAASACATTEEQRGGAPATAFVGVTVMPMADPATVLRDQTVVVADGRIAALGPRASTRVPAGATRIDGAGRWLLPGLADMHVHLEYFEDPAVLQLFLGWGVTTVRNMDGRPYLLDWRARTASGALPGPAIVTAGPIIDGSPPLRDDNLSVADAAAATAAVTAQADAGYDFVKLYTNLSPEAYRAAAAAARTRRLPLTGHVPRRIDLAEAAAAQASIEHLADYGEAIDARPEGARPRWHWSHLWLGMPADEARMRTLAALLAQSGVRAVPTLAESERSLGTAAQLASWSALAEMASMPAAGMALWRERVTRSSARLDAEDWALVERGRRNRLALVAALRAGRVPILAGTDTPNAFLVPGASLHDELALLVAAGLSPGEALFAATREPARFLARAGATGTIARGSRADLLLLSADPLADIANTRRIAGVMAGGRWYGPPELQAMRCAINPGCRR